MTFVLHVQCGEELIWKRQHLPGPWDGNERPTQMALWCPRCDRFVDEPEASRPGPYVAAETKVVKS